MPYNFRKTELSDLDYLPSVERSANSVYKLLPDLAWIADGNVMSVDEHKRALSRGFSWVALDTLSQTIYGFIIAEIIEGEFYVGEVSVSEANQQKGIGSKLFEIALSEAKLLGLPAATLTTFVDVPWNASYYERLGFVIIASDLLPLYLLKILQDQENAGLPLKRRCAMRKIL